MRLKPGILSSRVLALVLALAFAEKSSAVNPVVQTIYTADPAPMVHGDTVYLYAGHDEDDAHHYKMLDWRLFSSKDMVNWTDHGSPLSLRDFSWVNSRAWAGHTIERDGKFFWYVPMGQKFGGMAIGVAVADSPMGPFKDALGGLLVFDKFGDIDPAAFIDEDSQAYLVWGNPTYKWVRLNKDMISYNTSVGDNGIFRHPMTVEAFGQRTTGDRPSAYEEAPWIYKRDGIYYNFYAGGPVPEHLAYSTAPGPEGPWKYGGVLMPTTGNSSTNHPGVIDFKGKTYLFYHNADLPGGGSYKRSVCVEEFKFNPDGSISPLEMTKEGAAPAGNLNPYERVEAETIAWESGIETEPVNQDGMAVHDIDDGDYIRVMNVDFGAEGAGTFSASVLCDTKPRAWKGGAIELHLDRLDGPLIGTLPVSYTRGEWKTETTNVRGAQGVHDLFLVFKGESTGDVFKFDHWQFSEKTATPQLAAINAMVGRYKIDTAPPANRVDLKVTAIYSDGTSRDVTEEATVTPGKPGVVTASNGVIAGLAHGETDLQVSFEGKADTLPVIVKDVKPEQTARKMTLSVADVTLIKERRQPFTVMVEFDDGHTEELTHVASFSSANGQVATVENGVIEAVGKGETIIRAEFKGDLWEAVSAQANVTVTYRDAFARNEFEDFTGQTGLIVEDSTEAGRNLCDANDCEWCRFNAVDFGPGARKLEVRVASDTSGGNLEVRLDGPDGPLIARCQVEGTGGWQKWVTKTCEVRDARGVHDIFFQFKGGSGVLFNVNWWKFEK